MTNSVTLNIPPSASRRSSRLRISKSNFTYPNDHQTFIYLPLFCFRKLRVYEFLFMFASRNFTGVINFPNLTNAKPAVEIKTGKCILPLNDKESAILRRCVDSFYRIDMFKSYQFCEFTCTNKFTGLMNV